jgi:Holliday junction resolvasome RuvABC DNA-binding subunit
MLATIEPEALLAIPGVGEKSAHEWIEQAIKILEEEASNDKKAEKSQHREI